MPSIMIPASAISLFITPFHIHDFPTISFHPSYGSVTFNHSIVAIFRFPKPFYNATVYPLEKFPLFQSAKPVLVYPRQRYLPWVTITIFFIVT